MTTELATIEGAPEEKGLMAPVTVDSLCDRVTLVQEAMHRAMKEGVHYGKIPGCGPKPTLLKPGAEMLGTLFQMGHRYQIERHPEESGHMTFFVTCTVFYRPTASDIDSGIGCASTSEAKFSGGKNAFKKPHDLYNTCLKMAAKRALVAATINATGVSSLFTQDIEEDPGQFQKDDPLLKPRTKPQPVSQEPVTGGILEGTIIRSWGGNEYQGKTYWFAVVELEDESSVRVQTTDAELGEALKSFLDRYVKLLVEPASAPGKAYLKQILEASLNG
jgi:hypothetical protein